MKNIYILITILLLILFVSSLRITEGFDDKSCPGLSDIDKQIEELKKKKEDTRKSCVKNIILKNNMKGDVFCNPEKYGLTKDDLYKYSDAYNALVKQYKNIDIFCGMGELNFDK